MTTMRRKVVCAWLGEAFEPSTIDHIAERQNTPPERSPKAPTEQRSKKRQRLLSPPMSSTSSKRRRVEPPDQDSSERPSNFTDEETPRPTRIWAAPIEDDLQTPAQQFIGAHKASSLIALTPNPALHSSHYARAIAAAAESPTTPHAAPDYHSHRPNRLPRFEKPNISNFLLDQYKYFTVQKSSKTYLTMSRHCTRSCGRSTIWSRSFHMSYEMMPISPTPTRFDHSCGRSRRGALFAQIMTPFSGAIPQSSESFPTRPSLPTSPAARLLGMHTFICQL